MIPTKRGISLAVVGAVLYGLAWVTTIGWFYVADAVVWGILLVNLPLPWLSVRGVSAERRIKTGSGSGDIFEDDTITVQVELRNRSVLPKSLIAIREYCPIAPPDDRKQGFFIGTVAPRGRVVAQYDVRCYQRGVYEFAPVRLETSAPFGLFRTRRALKAPIETIVYPQVLSMEPSQSQGALQGSEPESSPPGPTGEFRGSREYQSTDSRRDIHWRTTARRGELMVREYDRTPQGEVRMAFNPAIDLGRGRENTLEYAIKIAASVAYRCFRDGRPCRIWPSPKATTGLPAWHELLEYLARLEAAPSPAVGELLSQRAGPGAAVFVVSAADRGTISMLRNRRTPSRATTVVLLQGFAPGEDRDAAAQLSQAGAQVLVCEAGRLSESLAAIGRATSGQLVAARRSRTQFAGVR